MQVALAWPQAMGQQEVLPASSIMLEPRRCCLVLIHVGTCDFHLLPFSEKTSSSGAWASLFCPAFRQMLARLPPGTG